MPRTLLVIAVLLVASAARADLTVEITKGDFKATPVAVVPFGWDGEGATAPTDVASALSVRR